jgi:hypothetical protein
MVTWELADGTEFRYEGLGVEPRALCEFVLRVMSSQGTFWDATHWSEDRIARAFEKRFASRAGCSGQGLLRKFGQAEFFA